MSDGMCVRCHFNVPFAPGEDFCLDCAGDVEREILDLKARMEEMRGDERPLLVPASFSCDPCECGGQNPHCPRCYGDD